MKKKKKSERFVQRSGSRSVSMPQTNKQEKTVQPTKQTMLKLSADKLGENCVRIENGKKIQWHCASSTSIPLQQHSFSSSSPLSPNKVTV